MHILYPGSILIKKLHRRQRLLILALLFSSVLAPLILVSYKLKYFSLIGRKGFVEDFPALKYRTESVKLNAIEQVAGKDFKGPERHVYEDSGSLLTFNSTNWSDDSKHYGNTLETSHDLRQSESAGYITNPLQNNGTSFAMKEIKNEVSKSDEQRPSEQTIVQRNLRNGTQTSRYDMVKEIKDQLVRAKAYLSLASPSSHSQFIRELRLRIKELERVVNVAKRNSYLSSALQRVKSMEDTLAKARRVFPHCSPMVKNLRALTYNAEEQVRAQRNQKTFLVDLAARTMPKGLHCLSLLLTAEYFALPLEKRQFPNQQRLHHPDLHHYVVFSDNILASAVVVDSTVSSAKGQKRPLWKAGSLPLGWATFYNQTVALDQRWHRLGLGYESGVRLDKIDQAAVLHYDGVRKPWLDIGVGNYKSYWSKHVKYDHPYLQQCNIQP